MITDKPTRSLVRWQAKIIVQWDLVGNKKDMHNDGYGDVMGHSAIFHD